MNEFELDRLYEVQLTAQVRNTGLPNHDRYVAAEVLAQCRRVLSRRPSPGEEHRTWVFSDPHFEDHATLEAFRRPFRTTAEGDGFLLNDWRTNVAEGDVVVCLGDVAIRQPSRVRLVDRIRRCPGRKILVAGNHDRLNIARLRQAFDEIAACAHLPASPTSSSHQGRADMTARNRARAPDKPRGDRPRTRPLPAPTRANNTTARPPTGGDSPHARRDRPHRNDSRPRTEPRRALRPVRHSGRGPGRHRVPRLLQLRQPCSLRGRVLPVRPRRAPLVPGLPGGQGRLVQRPVRRGRTGPRAGP